jgi:hypothetical protein
VCKQQREGESKQAHRFFLYDTRAIQSGLCGAAETTADVHRIKMCTTR